MQRTRTALALVVALLALAAAPTALAADSWQPVGGPIGMADPDPAGSDLKRIGGAPTLAYAHWNGTNHEIRVVRFEGGAWKQVGTQVNADPAHEATHPSLAAGPGGVPWVTWIEKDDEGIKQIRAARYSASKDRFVEPVGGDWPIQPRPNDANWEPQYFYGHRAQLAFVGSRAHIQMITETPSEFVIRIRRLAADRRSWRPVGTPSPRYAPSTFRGTVIDNVLHTSYNSRLGGAPYIDRLGAGGWEQVGGNVAESTPTHDEGSGGSLAAFGGVPHVSWNPRSNDGQRGMVARLVNGHWQEVGTGIGTASAGTLRVIGGRLWVALWEGGLSLARLSDDTTTWQRTATIPAASGAGLTGIDGVPHVSWLDADGRLHVSRLVGPAPAGGDDNDGTASPCAKADPELTKPVIAPPLPAAWPPPGSTDDPDTSCAMVDRVPPEDDEPGPNPPGPNPPGPNPPDPTPTPGPCGLRLLGTPKADRLTGDGLRNEIAGRSGSDTILGLGGDDCLFGNAGDDVLKGGPGADRLSGDSGHDRLVGGDGNDSVKAGPGNDVIDARGSGFDKIDCGPGRDKALVGDLDRVRNCERVVNVD